MSANPSHVSRFTSPRLIASLLFLAALAPRLPGLDRFLTSDENTNIFFAGSDVIIAFLQGDFRGTYWHFYPGVTMSWLDALGMGGQYLLELLSGVALPPFTEYIYSDILSLLVANRLPYVVLTAVAVPVIYLLARQLLPNRVALLGTLFLAFDPFYLAHSRVVQGDAPLAVFMALSTFTFLIYGARVGESTNQQASNPASSFTRSVHPSSLYLVASAILGGLAALTKAPGQFMPLFIVGMSAIYAGLELYRVAGRRLQVTGSRWQVTRLIASSPHASRLIITRWLTVIITWGLISLLTFALLWPAMWVDPMSTIQRMWTETFIKVDEGHLVYFFGQPILDPGPWFYPYVIPFRLTPVVLIGTLLSIGLLIFQISAPQTTYTLLIPHYTSHLTPHVSRFTFHFLWLFIISLLLFGNLSPKKQDRYLLPLFPFLDLLAAVGWWGVFKLTCDFVQQKFQKDPSPSKIDHRRPSAKPPRGTVDRRPAPAVGQVKSFSLRVPVRVSLMCHRLAMTPSNYYLLSTIFYLLFSPILLVFHLLPVFTYYPYYLTYFNPLMGGPIRASQTTLMGWGEGMEQVAAYLNTKPNAGRLYVASTPSQALLPYFVGTGENFYTNDIAFRADYVILYLAQMQRLAPSPEIVNYFQAQVPEKVITIHDVPYAKIYPGPKLILTDIPSEATLVNIGLGDIIRLAGYKVSNLRSLIPRGHDVSNLQLTLYWHALAPLPVNYTISVRTRAADGQLLAQQDSWPVNGLLPTSQWRQGDYVADMHTLDIPEADRTQVDHFEVVVYNAETGETLGPPITLLPLDNER